MPTAVHADVADANKGFPGDRGAVVRDRLFREQGIQEMSHDADNIES
jgi:hypothetical protein